MFLEVIFYSLFYDFTIIKILKFNNRKNLISNNRKNLKFDKMLFLTTEKCNI